MKNGEMDKFEAALEQVLLKAQSFGLDFFEMRFELVPAEILYTFGAYQGMPTRFSHWTFGKSFYRMKMDYDLGLSKIYELVINADPCYAFLLDSNSFVQNLMVSAHVLAHADFFKNNALFAKTQRDVVNRMSASSERFQRYEMQYGKAEVEAFLDAALAIQEHVDASISARKRRDQKQGNREQTTERSEAKTIGRYDDLFALDNYLAHANGKEQQTIHEHDANRKEAWEKDLLHYLIHHSPVLTDWQRDVLTVLRDEMLYFWPQLETKIMNEGWATYWHLRIMREMELTDDEYLDFARMHAGVVLPSKTTINPYYVGLKMWEDIDRRYPNSDKIFEVRATESDASFLRNYLTKELVEELDLYLYQKVGNEWRVVDTNFDKIRDMLWQSRTNGGYPVIYVQTDRDQLSGELYLWHAFEGVELDAKYTEKALPHVQRLWGRTVHLETQVDGRAVLFSCDGKKVSRRFLA